MSALNANEPLLAETTELGAGLPRRTRVVLFAAPIRQQLDFLKNAYAWLFLATLIITLGAAYPSLPHPGPVGEYLKQHEWPMWASLGGVVAASLLTAALEPTLRRHSPYEHAALWVVVLLQALFAAAVSAAYSTIIPAIVVGLASGILLLASLVTLLMRNNTVDASFADEPTASLAILAYAAGAVSVLYFWQHFSWFHILCTVGPATLLIVYFVRQVRSSIAQRPTIAPRSSYAPFGGDVTVHEHSYPAIKALHEPFTLFVPRIARPWLAGGNTQLEADDTV